MELALSLGDTSKPFKFLDKTPLLSSSTTTTTSNNKEIIRRVSSSSTTSSDSVLPVHELDLLPFSPVPRGHNKNSLSSQIRFPWLSHNIISDGGSADGAASGSHHDMKRLTVEDGTASSPNSAASSFQMDFGIISSSGRSGRKRSSDNRHVDVISENYERASSRASDDEENGLTRKKLRLSKEQSAFLEESFKEHNTLNPKQKLALANQLNLRPRQVEVWFQNRRARTKLKQTEVDCEYLKRCCETLTEENRRLQKEVQELRALKTSQSLFMQLPATTLTMCPSCERVATTNPAANNNNNTVNKTLSNKSNNLFPILKGQNEIRHQSTTTTS